LEKALDGFEDFNQSVAFIRLSIVRSSNDY
jgi:hypothetical protein